MRIDDIVEQFNKEYYSATNTGTDASYGLYGASNSSDAETEFIKKIQNLNSKMSQQMTQWQQGQTTTMPALDEESAPAISNKEILDYLKVQSFLMKEILDTLIELKEFIGASTDGSD